MAQRHPTENQKLTKSSRDIAHSEIFVDFRKKFAPNTNGTACAISNSQHPGSQWHSDCYTDFSWQSFLTIPMAQRLLHRILLAISFDNPNGTATVTQTSFGNFFWQSQWHSDCYTDFFWQFLLTIPMAQRLLHRLLLAISFDNPNGTATVTQTSFGNLFLTIPMAQRLLHRLLLAISFDNPNGTATVTQTSFGNLRSSDSPIKCVAKAAPATKHGDRDSFRWRRLVQEILMLLCHRNFFTFIPGPKTGNANESSKATKYCAQQQKW